MKIASATLLAALLSFSGCMSPPQDLDTALTRTTTGGKYLVTMVPPAPRAPINTLHTWQVKLATPAGAPVPHARIAVDGGMPQHGHGLPTQPRVREEPGDGSYLLEGMKFSMTGWWELKLAIQGPQGEDKVSFNTIVTLPEPKP